jgi:predicted ATPase
MINEFSLENFRVFRDKTTFKLKPITILTGPNNSGKSSVNKALLLLIENFKDISFEAGHAKLPKTLNFLKGNHQLSSFKKCVHQNSEKNNIIFGTGYQLSKKKLPFKILFEFINNERSGRFTSIEIIYKKTSVLKIMNFDQFNDIPDFWTFCNLNLDYFSWLEIFHLLKEESKLDNKDSIENVELKNKISKRTPKKFIELNEELLSCIEKQSFNRNNLFPFIPILEKLQIHIGLINSESELESFLISQGLKPSATNQKSISVLFNLIKNYNRESVSFSNEDIGYQIQQAYSKTDSLIDIEKITSGIIDRHKVGINNQIFQINLELSNLDFSIENSKIIEFENFVFLIFKSVFKQNSISLNNFIYLPSLKTDLTRGFESGQSFKSIQEFETKTQTVLGDPASPITNSSFSKHFLNWFKLFDLRSGFEIKYDEEGRKYHVYFRVHDHPFPVDVSLMRHLSDMGFGLQQIFMLILSLSNNTYNKTYIVEEPETSLHPKFQSRLADFFTSFVNASTSNLLIETHSEYFIRKLQYLIAKGEFRSENVVIYYIDDPDPNKREPNAPQVREITIDKFGCMSQDFGSGFFDEADNLAIQLFTLNRNTAN